MSERINPGAAEPLSSSTQREDPPQTELLTSSRHSIQAATDSALQVDGGLATVDVGRGGDSVAAVFHVQEAGGDQQNLEAVLRVTGSQRRVDALTRALTNLVNDHAAGVVRREFEGNLQVSPEEFMKRAAAMGICSAEVYSLDDRERACELFWTQCVEPHLQKLDYITATTYIDMFLGEVIEKLFTGLRQEDKRKAIHLIGKKGLLAKCDIAQAEKDGGLLTYKNVHGAVGGHKVRYVVVELIERGMLDIGKISQFANLNRTNPVGRRQNLTGLENNQTLTVEVFQLEAEHLTPITTAICQGDLPLCIKLSYLNGLCFHGGDAKWDVVEACLSCIEPLLEEAIQILAASGDDEAKIASEFGYYRDDKGNTADTVTRSVTAGDAAKRQVKNTAQLLAEQKERGMTSFGRMLEPIFAVLKKLKADPLARLGIAIDQNLLKIRRSFLKIEQVIESGDIEVASVLLAEIKKLLLDLKIHLSSADQVEMSRLNTKFIELVVSNDDTDVVEFLHGTNTSKTDIQVALMRAGKLEQLMKSLVRNTKDFKNDPSRGTGEAYSDFLSRTDTEAYQLCVDDQADMSMSELYRQLKLQLDNLFLNEDDSTKWQLRHLFIHFADSLPFLLLGSNIEIEALLEEAEHMVGSGSDLEVNFARAPISVPEILCDCVMKVAESWGESRKEELRDLILATTVAIEAELGANEPRKAKCYQKLYAATGLVEFQEIVRDLALESDDPYLMLMSAF